MSPFHLVFLSLAISHLLLIGLFTLTHHRKTVLGTLVALLMFSVICYLLADFIGLWPASEQPLTLVWAKIILFRIGNASTLLLWLVSYFLFIDHNHQRQIPKIVWILAISALIARVYASMSANLDTVTEGPLADAAWFYSQAVMLVFIFSALQYAVNGYKSDLVLERRRERVAFTFSIGTLLLLICANMTVLVAVRLFDISVSDEQPLPTVIYSIYTYFVIVALVIWKFRVPEKHLSFGRSSSGESLSGEGQDVRKCELDLIEKIKYAMEEDKLYLRPQLTVADLAAHISSQEYRVRRAINYYMRYRNFSEFLNQYRIEETSRLLLNTDEPISNVGIDAGYISLSSFYKAFKEKYSITPREYRVMYRNRATEDAKS